jgi:uncharacterized protein YqeY
MKLETLQNEMITAMKNKDKFRKQVISELIAAVKKAAIDKNCRDNITEIMVDEVLLKCKKTSQEQIDTCPADRVETLEEYKKQMKIISEFAPVLLTDEATILEMITSALAENNIEPLKKNKGAVMKTIMPMFKGKANMAVVNKVIGELLK